MPRGTQVKRDRLVITVGRGASLAGSKPPSTLYLVRKGPHWRRDCPPRYRSQRSDSQDNWDWRCLGVPTQVFVLITPEEPQVLITVEGQSISFGYSGKFLCAHWSSWSTFLQIHYHNGTVWMSQMLLFQSSFKLQLGLCTIFSQLSICAGVSLPPSGKGYSEQGPGLCFSWIWSLLFLSH